ncbi:MAG: NUDIX hydrolase [Betaproteobacteria bacterium]
MKYTWKAFLQEEELKSVGIVACLDDKGRFLVIRRSDIDDRGGQWTIPGGHIDEEDGSIEEGAIRELKEETGLTCSVSDLKYLGEPKPQKYYFLTRKWSGDVDVDIPNPKTGEIEHDDYKWATIDEIKELEGNEIPIYLLEKALDISEND